MESDLKDLSETIWKLKSALSDMTEQVEYMGKQADFETHGNKINHEDFPVVFY